jgi:hypothetical protein
MLDKINYEEVARIMIQKKLLSEAFKDESAFKADDFRLEDYLPKVALTPSSFKENAEKNFDTRLLEQMFASFRGGSFAESITKFNNALGIVTTPDGLVKYTEQAGPASGTDIYDSMALLNIMQTILAYDSTAAGTLFEKIVAGLLGGFHRGGSSNFEDVSVGNQTYSVKLLMENGEIKGSVAGLAVNVAMADEGTGVNFLIGLKSNPENSHVLKFVEFVVTKDSFFKFCGYEGDEPALITNLAKFIQVKVPVGFNNRKEAGYASLAEWMKVEYQTDGRTDPKFFFKILKDLKTRNLLYLQGRAKAEKGEYSGPNATAILLNPPIVSTQLAREFQTQLQHYYNNVIAGTTKETGQQQELSKWIELRRRDISEWIATVKANNTKESWTPAVLSSFEENFGKLSALNDWEVFKTLLFSDEMPVIFRPVPPRVALTKPGDKAALNSQKPGLPYIWNAFTRAPEKIQALRTQLGFSSVIKSLLGNVNKLTPKEKAFYTEMLGLSSSTSEDDILTSIKNNFKNPTESLLLSAEGKDVNRLEESNTLTPADSSPQFVVKATTVVNNLQSYNGKKEIPALIISKEFINNNATQRNDEYLKTIRPVFQEFHKVRVSLLKYYSGGFIEGIFETKKNIVGLDSAVSAVVSAESETAPPKAAKKAPAKKNLKENLLKRDAIDDILDLL